METRHLFGRTVITNDEVEITDSNIIDILDKAMAAHTKNRSEIQYLWDYYCGKQPILYREKKVRPEICNRIVENRANEIVSFKVGYLCGEPIQYIGRNGSDSVSKAISELNEMMFSENKASQDKRIAEWQGICGTAYRLVLPDIRKGEDDAPFELYTLDPRDSFVVYSNEVGSKPILGVKYCVTDDNDIICSVYSDKHYWKIKNGKIIESIGNKLGMIPIIEYPANNARLGAFEIVLPLLDAINNVSSNRMDGIEQFIQAFVKFVNCDITSEDFEKLKDLGAIKVKSADGMSADVDIVTNELNQMQTQTLVDYLYQTVLTICGMPSMSNGSTSDSSNNGAVILKNGWQGAETRAKDSELMFKEAEQKVLRIVLCIIRNTRGLSNDLYALRLKDISLQFTRRNYENIQSKSQVLVSMLQQNKIHPRLAFESSGLFVDPERAYSVSKEYSEEQEKKALEMIEQNPTIEDDDEGGADS